ncbi:hypothetical protein T484DRAFT_1835283 [Baffinella frigidus]|nr:hypothetical protein T484DRAFT_1835283 [Cryptophyta sp. CCMP2293]
MDQVCMLLLLVLIIVMENDSRGVLLGAKMPSLEGVGYLLRRSLEGVGYLLRRYHGYGFSMLIIHVFWFHPPVATLSHAIGYFHSVLLLVQSSLFFTRLHLNPYWKLLLESLFL